MSFAAESRTWRRRTSRETEAIQRGADCRCTEAGGGRGAGGGSANEGGIIRADVLPVPEALQATLEEPSGAIPIASSRVALEFLTSISAQSRIESEFFSFLVWLSRGRSVFMRHASFVSISEKLIFTQQ